MKKVAEYIKEEAHEATCYLIGQENPEMIEKHLRIIIGRAFRSGRRYERCHKPLSVRGGGRRGEK